MIRLPLSRRVLITLVAGFIALAGLVPTSSVGADLTAMEGIGGEYIVVLRDLPLAEYRGGVPGIPATQTLPGRNRLDVRSASAQAYTEYVRARQVDAEAQIAQTLGRTPAVTLRTQHALNAIVMTLTPAEVEAVKKLPEVLLLDPVRHVPMDTDTGPAHIGAPAIWAGTAPGNPVAAQGEGMVIGVIDSGINFGSPSFAAVDPVDGYVHVNPLGSGTFLGTCLAGVDVGRCNDKLIGGYDFVCGAPGNQCIAANREEPGFGDTNGHGSHTASTAAGNRRSVVVSGVTRSIQGVAPRANVISYDVCYTNIASGQGLCPNVSSVAAVNQAIADGVVDAINFSIGGGASPWGDAVSLAFLGATNAGIYVATSAGNTGPGANTMGHHEPWTASTAAAQHGRGPFRFFVNVTGPGTVPPNLASIPTNEGLNGVAFAAAIPGTTPIIGSPNFAAPAGDGCVAYPAGTFTGAIALVNRGVCSFTIKANAAAAAGAIAVLIANNAAGEIAPSVPTTTIPVFGILQADGAALLAFVTSATPPPATAGINFPATVTTNTADQLASFSSRGPAAALDLMKPDLTAPGVDVLAAYAGTTISPAFDALTGVISGTSMASPHNAGSALLLKQLKPTWSVMEVKSALEMTTTRTVFKEDGVTPATPHDMGGGRIRVDRAANAGLVMNELAANMQAANPAAGGNPTTLNLPSYAKNNCVGSCTFTRVLRSPLGASKTWNAAVTGLTGTVSPATFTVPAGGAQIITVTINTTAIPADGAFRYGWVELTPTVGTPDDKLTMPIGVTVAPPVITLTPATQNVALVEGQTGSASYTVANAGGAALTYTAGVPGNGAVMPLNASSAGAANGFRSTRFTDPGTAGANAVVAADDFTIVVPTTITRLQADGFVNGGGSLANAADITWAIYTDNGATPSFPSGNPVQGNGTVVWFHTAATNAPGVSIANNIITLDLVAAGLNPTLAPGKYWFMVIPRTALANSWFWLVSTTGSGTAASVVVSTTNTGNFGTATPPAGFNGLNFRVWGTTPCTAPWIGATTPASGTLAGGASAPTSTSLSAVGLTAGTYTGAVCFGSNDPATPIAAESFQLTVTAPAAGTASKLAFTTPPSSTANTGVAFPQQPVVTVQDSADATVPGYVTPVTLSVATGTGTLQCDVNPVVPVSGVATFSGCSITGAGTVTLRASSGTIPNSTTNPSITVAGAASQLAFTTEPGNGTGGVALSTQPVVSVQDAGGNTITLSSAAITLAITTSAGSTLTCTANPVAASAGVATFSGCSIDKPGTYTLTASSPGLPIAVSASFSVAVGAPSSLAFSTQPGNGLAGGALTTQPAVSVFDAGGNFVSTATVPVTLSLNPSGTISCAANPQNAAGGVATFSGCSVAVANTYTLTASSPGLASAISSSFTVGAKTNQTITFGPLGAKLVTDADFAVAASASSGLAVTFGSDTPAVCTVSGAVVHLVAAGTCTIRASQAGNATFNPAPDATQSFLVSKVEQTITFGSLANKLVTDADFTVAATASSGLAVAFGSDTPTICTVSTATVHLVAAGTCTIRATQAGNATYNAATFVARSFTVSKQDQTITFGSLANKLVTDPDFTVAATASSSLAVAFASDTPGVCTVSTATVHLVTGGTCTIRATQAGNATYNPATAVTQSFTVSSLQDQTITFAPLAAKYVTDADFTVAATASSGLAVAFGSDTPTICTVSTATVHLVAEGNCTIRATQAGNATNNPAPAVTQSFAVKSATLIPRLANISTRMQVLTGNDVLIGGFIIGGSVPKTVVVRARGPSLTAFGITNALPNPRIDLYSGATVIASNNGWRTAPGPEVTALQAAGFEPGDDLESAIIRTLDPGSYTTIVSGVGGTTGVGIVEVFEVNHAEVPLTNLSARGQVRTGNDVMIGGFVIQGEAPRTVVIRARGPSLGAAGIADPLLDPVLQLFEGQTEIATNDDWQLSLDMAAIQASGFAPSDPREATIRITLPPGSYTAIVTGKGGLTGVGIVEVFVD